MKRIIIAALALGLCAPPLAAQQLLVPMDQAQTDHLKAYGLTFWVLDHRLTADWLLNYRDGSFLLPDRPDVRREAAMRGVTTEPVSVPRADFATSTPGTAEVPVRAVRPGLPGLLRPHRYRGALALLRIAPGKDHPAAAGCLHDALPLVPPASSKPAPANRAKLRPWRCSASSLGSTPPTSTPITPSATPRCSATRAPVCASA